MTNNYNGNIYGKGALVNAVIRDYVSSCQGVTYAKLVESYRK